MNDADDYLRHVGAQTRISSRSWGKLTAESVKLTPASDGDLAVYIGTPLKDDKPLVRIHSECVFGEALESTFCDCAEQFRLAMRRLCNEGSGILFYLRFDGRGAGLAAKVKATALEMNGIDTYESRVAIGVKPEGRDFKPIGEFLLSKGIHAIRLLTNNPDKAGDIRDLGIEVDVERLIVRNPNKFVKALYKTKRSRFGHDIPSEVFDDPQMTFEF
jgi:GTP cyclohydrolase II